MEGNLTVHTDPSTSSSVTHDDKPGDEGNQKPDEYTSKERREPTKDTGVLRTTSCRGEKQKSENIRPIRNVVPAGQSIRLGGETWCGIVNPRVAHLIGRCNCPQKRKWHTAVMKK